MKKLCILIFLSFSFKNKDDIPTCCRVEDLGFLGCGIPLFYTFVKYGILFLFIIFAVTGIFGMIFNDRGDGCIYSN
jgi:hypothetical protein